jgi:small GTP-binding protein
MTLKKAPSSPDAKVILVGDTSVGKTSLLSQFKSNTFNESTESTVGAHYVAKQVETSHGRVDLVMWDTAGQERYRSLIPMYSRDASAAVLVLDVANRMSYDSLEPWYRLLKEKCPYSTRIYVVANKIDLEPRIPIYDLEKWAHEHRLPFFKSCAMWHETVEPIFKQVAEDAGMALEAPATRTQGLPLRPAPAPARGYGCC